MVKMTMSAHATYREGIKMFDSETWLTNNGYRLAGDINPNTIPIFIEGKDGVPVFQPEYGCVGGAQRVKFITEAPKDLWLGGGAVIVSVRVRVGDDDFRDGYVSIPDRRHGGNLGPTAQGWAMYAEGHDLSIAACRELMEEIDVYTLAEEGDDLYQPCTEVLPAGFTPKGRVDSLNLVMDDTIVYGKIQPFFHCLNKKDRAYIYVGQWDLREMPRAHRLRVVWEDDFPKGLRPGTNPRVISARHKMEIGTFEGAQGFVRKDAFLHPVMQDCFEVNDLPR